MSWESAPKIILKFFLKDEKKTVEGEEEDENPISRTAAGENVEIKKGK